MARLLLAAAGALIDRDGRVLLARRPPEDKLGGLWEFPGGKLHEGETPEAALIRELEEELGIRTDATCLAPIAFASEDCGEFHLLMPLFACRKWKGEPAARVHADLTWARGHELTNYKMPPADRPLAAQLRDAL